MNERGYSFEPEEPAGRFPGSSRSAHVARLHRPAKPEKPDVDNLVTDFLQALNTYSSEGEASDIAPPQVPAQETSHPEPPALELSEKAAPPVGPIVPVEVNTLHAEVDAELERTLREIEMRPKLTIVQAPVHAVPKAPSVPSGVSEAVSRPETPDPVTVETEIIGGAKPATPHEALPDDEIWNVVRPKTKTGQGTMRLPLTYPLQTPWVKYRLVVGIPVLIGIAVVAFAIYFFSMLSSTPTTTGSDRTSQNAVQTPGATSTQSNAAGPGALPDQPPLKASAPIINPVKSAPAQSARSVAPPPGVKTPAPPAREENNRAKTVALANLQVQSRGSADNASDPGKQATAPRREVQGNDNAVVTTLQPPSPPSSSAGTKSTEPPAAAPAGQKATETPASATAKANVEPPALDASKVSPTAPPPAAETSAAKNPAETAAPKVNSPEAKVAPAPLVIPAEPVFRASPNYPATAQKMGVTGTVDVRVSIDEKGKVTKATAISGHNLLRFAAEDALLRWKFKPATLRGISVKSELVVSVSFVR